MKNGVAEGVASAPHDPNIDLAVVFPYDPINYEKNPEIRKNINSLCYFPRNYPPQNGFLVPISAEKYGPEWSKHFPMAEKNLMWNKVEIV